jgi:type I restriction enzyme S subunit
MMRKMKDSGVEWIGEIPEDWEITPVKRHFLSVKRVVGSDVDSYERLALTMNGVIKRSKDDSEGLQPKKFEGYQILKQNELVFKLIDLENVKTSRVGLSPYTGLVSPAYIIISNNREDNRYFYYYFMFMYYNEVYNRLGGDGVRSALNAKDVLCLPIMSINDDTMTRIADYLDDKCDKIDAIIAKEQAVIEKLKAYKLSLITETVTKGLNPDVPMKDSGIEFVGNVPEHWSILQLRYVGYCQNGISKGGEFFGSGLPFVNYSDVYKNYELPEIGSGLIESTGSERDIYSVQKGDIFFTRTSETIEEVGLTSVCMNTMENATFAGFLIRVRPKQGVIEPKFSKYYFRSEHHRRFIVKEMNLVTRASLGQELLKRLPVLLPPIDEQKSIAAYLENKCNGIDSAIDKKQAVINKLTEYKKSLIYEVVTGKKEV